VFPRSAWEQEVGSMAAEILSKKLENGMVLVGEPTKALESAAFTFLARRPVVCFDPPKRAGLASLTGEMIAARGRFAG